MVALYTEGFCITNICFSLDIYVKLIKSLPNQATQLTASPPPLGTEKDRKSKSSSFLSSVPKYKYRVLLFYTLISSNASSIPSGVINVTCRLRSLKSIVILLLITLHISPYKFVYDEG